MQIITVINNVKCKEWGINANQGAFFSYLYDASMEGESSLEIGFSRKTIIKKLPLYFRQEDTVYRAYKALAKAGVIAHRCDKGVDFYKITSKGKEWFK